MADHIGCLVELLAGLASKGFLIALRYDEFFYEFLTEAFLVVGLSTLAVIVERWLIIEAEFAGMKDFWNGCWGSEADALV